MKKLVFRAVLLLSLVMSALVCSVSPAQAAPGDFLFLWGSQQHFSDPSGIALDAAGNVYVTDTDNIQVFNSAGKRIKKWGSFGSGDGQLSYPRGISIDATGRVYVADTGNERIEVFDTSGNFIGKWGYPNWDTYPPIAVASDGKGKVYVAEAAGKDNNGNYSSIPVKVFDSEGNYLRDLGSIGTGVGQYGDAGALAVDTNGNVYVGDEANLRVQVYSSTGTYIRNAVDYLYSMGIAVDASGNVYVAGGFPFDSGIWIYNNAATFTKKVTFWDEFMNQEHYWEPNAVALDGKGNVYTVDFNNDGVRVFDSTGKFLSQWWSYGTGLGQLSRPTWLTVGKNGNVYETDGYDYSAGIDNTRVQVFTADGVPVARWVGDFVQTAGLVIDSGGNVNVLDASSPYGDAATNVALVFDSSGNFLRKWGETFYGDQGYSSTYGIAIDKGGRFLVTDTQYSVVRAYDSQGNFLRTFGTPGTGNGQFDAPKGIAVDTAGNIFVADSGNSRIEVFDANFNFVRKWGSRGFSTGYFSNPSGVAVDGAGHVFVADAGNNRIQIFDSAGLFLKKIGGPAGDANALFRAPEGVALNPAGTRLYVADTYNNRIQAFEGYGAAATYSMSGVVRQGSATGAALAGATVSIAGKTATTSSTGSFSITGIPAGTYTLTVSKTGYATKTTTGYAVSGNQSGLCFFLLPAYSMSGTVRQGSSTGPILAGATVSIAGKTATTSSTGTFSITGIPSGTYTLTISKTGYATRTVTGYAVTGNQSGLVFYLLPTYSLSGTVREGSGTGPVLPGATVSIAGKTTTTGSTGTFSITGIPSGTYTVTISKTGYTAKSLTGYPISGNRTGVVFYLVRSASSRGAGALGKK